jgi:hypothetical protein
MSCKKSALGEGAACGLRGHGQAQDLDDLFELDE